MKKVTFWEQHQRWPTINLIVSDITTLEVDGVVTGVKSDFILSGGVNSAIHRVAGSELTKAVAQFSNCPLGQAVITAAYRLPAKYVIHTACPMYNEAGTTNDILAKCYDSSLGLALESKLHSIAFPALATGMFSFPHKLASGIAARSIRNFIFEKNEPQPTIKEIIYVVFQPENFLLYEEKFSEIFV